MSTLEEVLEYLPALSAKRGVSLESTASILNHLPLSVHPSSFFHKSFNEAWIRIHKKDEDDVPLLALALTLNCPIWTNNLKDFRDGGVETHNTESLLKMLKLI